MKLVINAVFLTVCQVIITLFVIKMSTGYGPSARQRLLFDGSAEKYELWEVKFLAYARIQDLHHVFDSAAEVNVEDNEVAFAQLVQFLDDRSLSLVIRDAKDDGRKALRILQEHYVGKGKPRIISLYHELTSLQLQDECLTDYVIRAETAANSLKAAGETVSDALLVAMVLKGLTPAYKTFSTVITQRETPVSFADFKVALRNYEETEKAVSDRKSADNVMNVKQNTVFNGKCFECGGFGHKAVDCKSKKEKKWCSVCRSTTHYTRSCRKKDSAKTVKDEPLHSYAFTFCTDTVDTVCNKESFLVDCGATAHIIHDRSKFVRFDESFKPENHSIELADGSRTSGVVLGKGDAEIELWDTSGSKHSILLQNALYVPTFRQNIFSVQAATEKGASAHFGSNHSEFKAQDGRAFEIEKHGRLYYLNNTMPSKVSTRSAEEWHRTFGHCNMRDVSKLENVVEGMKIAHKDFDCSTCTIGKMPSFRNREADRRAVNVLDLVHCDLAGPIDPVAKDGFRYAISFVDDYSGINMTYFLKSKSDTSKAAEKFIADCSPYGKIKRLRTDNGTEFTSAEFKALLVKNQIKHEKSAPYSPHQNGTVERTWRSIFDMARCLLLESNLQKYLWTYAVMTAVHIRNRCFNPRIDKTPYEAFTGHKPNVSGMHIFGTTCFAQIQNPKKLDARSERGIFVGYDRESPAYLVYFRETGQIKKVRCVKFKDEYENDTCDLDTIDHVPRKPIGENDAEVTQNVEEHRVNVDEVPKVQPVAENVKDETKRYPTRDHRKPKYLENYDTSTSCEGAKSAEHTIDYCCRVADIPVTYADAIRSRESDKWQAAMEEEMNALLDNNTFELAEAPKDRKVVGGRWVYDVKLGSNDEERYKARYVAKGYSQVADIDYQETFSPTARVTSIRMLLQLAIQNDLIVNQMDVKTAYLNAPIDCDVFVEQPEGFVEHGENGEKLVCKLKKSLYGLKQSGRNWNTLLHDYLVTLNFVQSLADNCVYTRDDGNVIVLIWVDDIIIAAKNESLLQEVKDLFSQRFKMKDLGSLSWFLGIEFQRKDDCYEMYQTKYLERMLAKFNMVDCKPRATPCDLDADKMKCDDSEELGDAKLYRCIVGSLIYAMTGTRPDLCYVVTLLSQHMSKPTKAHLNMAKKVLRYIKGTLNYRLKFTKCVDDVKLVGCSDSDWGGSEDRRSVTGYGFQLNTDGPLVSWKSKKQQTVALSTCEAEYMALAAATQEAKFLRQLLADMQCCEVKPAHIHVDNQGAIALAKNPVYHQRSKHIDIKYHFVRLEIQLGVLFLSYIPSEENIADLFTKPVSKARLNLFFHVKDI